MRAKHFIVNEMVYFSLNESELKARVQYLDLLENISPDQQVRAYLGWDTNAPEGAFLHSTSWRYDYDTNSMLITWAIYPDPSPTKATQAVDVYIPEDKPDAIHPGVKRGDSVASVAHAARHLAFLRDTDPSLLTSIRHSPALREALENYAPAMIEDGVL